MLNYCVFVVTGLTYTIYPFVYIQRLQACSRDYLRDSPCDRLWAAFLASTLFHDDFGPPFILFVFIFDCRLLPKVGPAFTKILGSFTLRGTLTHLRRLGLPLILLAWWTNLLFLTLQRIAHH